MGKLSNHQDLIDLKIPCSFDFIKSKSKQAFKNLVKSKVKSYALRILKTKQQKHSKMSNLQYSSLDIQSYFTSSQLKQEDKRTIFRYRVKMARYGENFRGGANSFPCPLCKTHLDNQEMSFTCPIIKKEIDIKGNSSDIYKENIHQDSIETILKISSFRKRNLEKQ